MQPFTITSMIGVSCDHPALKKALEEVACAETNMCLPPAGSVYLVSVRGRPRLVKPDGLKTHRKIDPTPAKVLGVLHLRWVTDADGKPQLIFVDKARRERELNLVAN